MTHRRRYPSHISTDTEWLGEIPAHWETHRFKALIRSAVNGVWGGEPQEDENDVICVRVADFDYNQLNVDPNNLTIRNIDTRHIYLRKLEQGDLLIEKSGGGEQQPVGRVVNFTLDEKAVFSNFITRLIPNQTIHSRYLCYVFFAAYAVRLNIRSVKQTTGIQNLDLLSYLNETAPTPPFAEQIKIVTFLDHETSMIDKLIKKNRQLIKKLNEQRLAIISHKVINGLDSSKPKGESETPWLNNLPIHWKTSRLKFISYIQSGLTLGKRYDNNRILVSRPYLRVANVQDSYLDLSTITEVDIPPEDTKRYELQPGDVLMTEGGDFDKLGRGHVWEGEIEGCLHQNHVYAVRPAREEIDPYYLSALTTSFYGKNYFTYMAQQTTNLATINKTTLGNFPCPLPPIQEQRQIVTYLNEITQEIDTLIHKVEKTIEKLEEYRVSLISTAVTGKIDVRSIV